MTYFPQLSSGSLSQYPLSKTMAFRTVVNKSVGGVRTTFPDRHGVTIHWDLNYQGLTQSEADSLRMLFEETHGRLKPFLFLDPTSNLILWSERLDKPVWSKDSLLTLTAERPDPLGTHRAARLVNGAQSNQRIRQELAAPCGLTYCLALTCRAEEPTDIELTIQAGGETFSRQFRLADQWSEASVVGITAGDDESIAAVVSLPPGASVDVFGLHVQPQAGSDGYRATTDLCGIHSETYFDTDEIEIQADRNDEYSCRIRLTSRVGSNQ